jgi:hypothetical protein
MVSLLRLFIIALLFYLVVWVVRGLVRPAEKGPPDGVPDPGDKELVPDSFTGTYFEKSKAVTVNTGGAVHYFSCEANRDAWLRRKPPH